MIRKMIHMNVPAELLHEIFVSSQDWPKWMPGMKSTRMVAPGEKKHIVWVEGTYAGIKFSQEMEVVAGRDYVRQRQLEGWPVKWGVTWRLIKPPSGTGTTVVAEVEMEFGALAPKKMIMSMLRRMVGDMLNACKKRAEGLHRDQHEEPVKAQTTSASGVLLSVYQSEKGLEVTVGDRTFVIADQ